MVVMGGMSAFLKGHRAKNCTAEKPNRAARGEQVIVSRGQGGWVEPYLLPLVSWHHERGKGPSRRATLRSGSGINVCDPLQ